MAKVEKTEKAEVELVKMVNAEGKEADVHPDEVFEYAKGGYVEVK
jgi:hypothetical protein